MKLKPFSSDIEDKTSPFICYAEPEEPEEGGGNTGETDPKPDQPDFAKMFTDLSSTVSKAVSSLQKEISQIKATDVTKPLQDQLKEIREQLNQSKEKDDKNAKGTPDEVFLRQQLKELQDQSKRLEAELTQEKTARQVAEEARRNTERDRVLSAALASADSLDPDLHATLYRDKVVYNDDDGKFYYQDGDEQLKVEDGIKKYLPAYMRKAKNEKGGSGGRGPDGNPTSGSKKAQLEQLAIDLGIQAKKNNGQQNDFSKYQRARREAIAAGGDDAKIVSAVNAANV